ncbi:hypothetical protein I3760_10G064600 [Carya illinoinensis]|nr:hypothetical protein I3760_10G064600 [Carya illinoinensis]
MAKATFFVRTIISTISPSPPPSKITLKCGLGYNLGFFFISSSSSPTTSRRAALSLSLFSTAFPTLVFSSSAASSSSKSAVSEFSELPNSGGVKVLDLRFGSGDVPRNGDQVAVHYYGRLAAKQGWRFDSTYDHKDENGEPIPFVFFLGSGKVISGIEAAVRSMKVGGIRRAVIPPSQGYQSTSQEPIPPNYFDRQRLFTTIFNPTRLANGEGSTLGTLIFDIELVSLRHQ